MNWRQWIGLKPTEALVPWTDAERIAGRYFKPTTEDHPRIRVDSFPTPDELAELQRSRLN